MSEPSTTTAGALWLLKYYGWKIIAGAIAVALGFLILWPKTAKEGAARIAATITGSMLFGSALVDTVKNYLPFLGLETIEAQMPVFVVAGLPAWWVLGWAMRWLNNRAGKDAGQVIDEIRNPPAP